MYNAVSHTQHKAFTRILLIQRKGFVEKLNNILNNNSLCIESDKICDNYVINLSSIEIPTSVNTILSLHHTHNSVNLSSNNKTQIFQLIATTEMIIIKDLTAPKKNV